MLDLQERYLNLSREEQDLMKKMIEGTVLPDTDDPIQKRISEIEEELQQISTQTNPENIQKWLDILHNEQEST